ncbi:30S ribosomal protein S2 [bioreactor metagenome]|uniref:30S ribosomal protein S2 n=1 Tax=bioreactor metagenome TaxID=1076179 RepID=A0A644V7E1_9ZZZZ|nr:30S ribosomal protein S2 [Candidatus Elulimicrobiales bacterium]
MADIENIKIEDLAKAGVAYGYRKTRRHPSAKDFIYTTQNGVDLIDLNKTKEQLKEAVDFLKSVKAQNKKIIFIGEKPEVVQIVKEVALSLGEPYIVNRFIGGSITNFPQIKKRVEKLQFMLDQKEKGDWAKFTKKEQLLMQRELEKLDKNFGGLSGISNLPGAIVVVDSKHEEIPVREAAIAHIPVVSLSNTDCDISTIEYPIVCNDSSRSSVEILLNIIKENIK